MKPPKLKSPYLIKPHARVRLSHLPTDISTGPKTPEAAAPIASAVSPAGQLWLSGILRGQEAEVIAAYEAQKLRHVRSLRRGKWVMLQWTRPD